MMLHVTGKVVNLRRGPGIGYYRVMQVQQGDQLQVTGRNADASWLQVVDPYDPAAWLWISRGLTSLSQAEAKVDVAEVEIPSPPPVRATACPRLHEVNPNEKHLVQITDWYGLDVTKVAALNGIVPETPLRAGFEICLAAANG